MRGDHAKGDDVERGMMVKGKKSVSMMIPI